MQHEVRRRVLVVIPAFDEEVTVADVVTEVHEHLEDADVLVVDDGSQDATARKARDAGAWVATLPYNLGVGGAMRTGFRFARRHGYDAVVQVDADGQHDAADLVGLLAALDDADVVIGARFAGRDSYPVGGARRLAMWLLARELSRRVGDELTDVTSGFRASGPAAIELFADAYPVEYLGDTVESLVIAARAGLRIRQIPAGLRPRAGGNPSQRPLAAAAYLGRALVILVLSAIRHRPEDV